jgi:hypothetical protein
MMDLQLFFSRMCDSCGAHGSLAWTDGIWTNAPNDIPEVTSGTNKIKTLDTVDVCVKCVDTPKGRAILEGRQSGMVRDYRIGPNDFTFVRWTVMHPYDSFVTDMRSQPNFGTLINYQETISGIWVVPGQLGTLPWVDEPRFCSGMPMFDDDSSADEMTDTTSASEMTDTASVDFLDLNGLCVIEFKGTSIKNHICLCYLKNSKRCGDGFIYWEEDRWGHVNRSVYSCYGVYDNGLFREVNGNIDEIDTERQKLPPDCLVHRSWILGYHPENSRV